MMRALDELLLAARSEAPIMLHAEIGMEVAALARLAHDNSRRRDRPFVALSCPTITDLPPMVFRINGGTLFLDGVGDLTTTLQTKLVHVLDKLSLHGATTRVISATRRDLNEDIARGRFRQDLFFRLNVVDIRIPPLRERPEDILPLAQELVLSLCADLGRRVPLLSENAVAMLLRYSWPANLRELRNVIERALLIWPTDLIGPEALSEIRTPVFHRRRLRGR